MRTLLVAACLLLTLPALMAAPDATPAQTAAGDTIDWARQADATLAAVKPRLQLSDAQVAQLRPLLAAYLPKLRGLFDSYAGEGIESGPALITEFREAREAFKQNLDPILNDAQKKEFLVLRGEVDGEIRKAFVEARLGWDRRTLGIDDAQVEKARPIVADNFNQRLQILSMHADSPGGPAASRPLWPELEKVQQETDARLRGVFTPQQMETYLAAGAKKTGGA
jgi:hypothetical protein